MIVDYGSHAASDWPLPKWLMAERSSWTKWATNKPRPAGFEFSEQLIQRYSIGRPRPDVYKEGGLSGIQLRRALEYIEECLGLDLDGKKRSPPSSNGH